MARKSKSQAKSEQADLQEPAKTKSAKPYTVGQWKGMPQYQCNLCAFDTLDEGAMKRHLEQVHFPPKPAHRANVLVADKRGKEVGIASQARNDIKDISEIEEIELEEVSRSTDAQGNEHVEYTIKE